MHVAGKCFRLTPVKHVFGDSARSSARGNAVTELPHEHDATPHTLRDGVHDLRNVLNAVQMNAFAARQLVEQPARTLACLTRIEAAVERGNGVLAHMPTDETLVDRRADPARTLAGRSRRHLRRRCIRAGARPVAPGAVRGRGRKPCARRARLPPACRRRHDGELSCEAQGLQAPGPIATALAGLPRARIAGVGRTRGRRDGPSDGPPLRTVNAAFTWPLPT